MSLPPPGDWLQRNAARAPRQIALVDEHEKWTWSQLHDRAQNCARVLGRAGLTPADRVAIALPPGFDPVAWIWGALLSDLTFVVLDPSLPASRRHAILEDCRPRVLVTEEGTYPLARVEAENPSFDSTTIANLVYTSGSRGEPKGVAMGLDAMTAVVHAILDYLPLDEEDVVWGGLPLHYGYGLYQIFLTAKSGASLVLPHQVGFVGHTLHLLRQHRVTTLPGVPSLWAQLLASSSFDTGHLPDLRRATNAGDRLPNSVRSALHQRFPDLELHSMYGLSECTRVSSLPPSEIDLHPTSVGYPISGCEVRIVDDEGHEVPEGSVGELVVRGPHLMSAYWNRPRATAETLRPLAQGHQRWLWTGDWFRRDRDGRLYHCGRKDDGFKCRGQKVAPQRVAEVLEKYPSIQEAVVLPRTKSTGETTVHAVLRTDGESVILRDLQRFCRHHLAVHEIPTSHDCVDSLPRTPRGKIDRDQLLNPRNQGEQAQCSSATVD